MPPNVLLIILDSVRARNCSVYSHKNETTPFLNSFKQESIVYSQARAPGIWSFPSHASMFTGYHVEEHGLVSRNETLESGHTIWERLQDECGYSTGIFTRNPFPTRETYGLHRGFDTIASSLPTRTYPFENATNPIEFVKDPESERSEALQYLSHCLEHENTVRSFVNGAVQKFDRRFPDRLPSFLRPDRVNAAETYTRAFLDWEREQRGPWAACVNLMDAHGPYLSEPQYDRWGDDELRRIHDDLDDHRWDFYSGRKPWWQREALEALYDGCIRQLDAAVERIVDSLRRRGVLRNTLLVITSDHGEGFGERSRLRTRHRIVGHNSGIHEVLLHVPLLVRYPTQSESVTVDRPATLTRLPAVICNCIDDEQAVDDFVPDGPVVAGAEYGGRHGDDVRSLDSYRSEIDMSFFQGTARAVYTSDRNRVEKQMSWDDASAIVECLDAQNSMRVSTKRGEKLTEACETLTDLSVQMEKASPAQVDAETKRKLRELGYA